MARIISLEDWHGQILNVDVEIDWGPEDEPGTEVIVISTSDGSNGAEISLHPYDVEKIIDSLKKGLDKLKEVP